jgi:hypothetical protein
MRLSWFFRKEVKMKTKKYYVVIAAALALVVSASAYVFAEGPLKGPPIADLTGTWNVWSVRILH